VKSGEKGGRTEHGRHTVTVASSFHASLLHLRPSTIGGTTKTQLNHNDVITISKQARTRSTLAGSPQGRRGEKEMRGLRYAHTADSFSSFSLFNTVRAFVREMNGDQDTTFN
jgi:hypothetical protein